MNDKLLLAGKLYQLSDLCKEIGHLLEKLHHEIPLQDREPFFINSTLQDDIKESTEWPLTKVAHFEPKYSDVLIDLLNQSEKILECLSPIHLPLDIQKPRDLLSNIHHIGDYRRFITLPDEKYELIILNHYLEHLDHPLDFLIDCKSRLKSNGKLYLLLKPWTSNNGGHQSSYFNKAFAHLCYDLTHNNMIKYKVTRPQANLQELFNKAGMNILNRYSHIVEIPDFILFNNAILDHIILKTWGTMRKKDALSIMQQDELEWVISK